jgi:hypothetical protein
MTEHLALLLSYCHEWSARKNRKRERYKSQQNSNSQTDEWLQYKIFIYLEVIK